MYDTTKVDWLQLQIKYDFACFGLLLVYGCCAIGVRLVCGWCVVGVRLVCGWCAVGCWRLRAVFLKALFYKSVRLNAFSLKVRLTIQTKCKTKSNLTESFVECACF